MAKNNTATIRIVKKKKGHAGHHGGAWKVAYADFVTAMMAFFLVMWIIGLNAGAKAAIAAYFKDPKGFMQEVKAGNSPFAVADKKGIADQGSSTKTPPLSPAKEREKLTQAKKTIEKLLAKSPEFKNLKEFVELKMVNEGLKIELVEAKDSLFFQSASPKLEPEARRLLVLIARELAPMQNKLFIEGHTDIRPLNRADGYSNWELSADRANSARDVLEASGITDKRIGQIRGCAATQLRDPEHPDAASNRRVSIIVVTNEAATSQADSVTTFKDIKGTTVTVTK